MFDIIGMLVLVALIGLGIWLIKRASGSSRLWLKRIGVPLAGVLTVVVIFAFVLAGIGFYKLSAPPNHPVADVQIANTPAQIARGQYLAGILCAGCHSMNGDLPLNGGKNLADDIGLPLGALYAANLTSSGDIKNWSDGEILRALRWGQHRSGRALAMPVKATSQLSAEDAQAIVAYLRSQPAVENKLPATSPSLLFGMLVGANLFDLSAVPDTGPIAAPARATTADYGQYLVNIADCKTCHGEDLLGGKPPAPQGPSLRDVSKWTPAEFVTAMRTGEDPDGYVMQESMPWKSLAKMDDVDLAAMYAYLHTLSAPAK